MKLLNMNMIYTFSSLCKRKYYEYIYLTCLLSQAIIWDQSLAGPIGLVAKYNLLEEYGVVKMYPLCGGALTMPSNIANIIFISRPQLELMDLIAENVHG